MRAAAMMTGMLCMQPTATGMRHHAIARTAVRVDRRSLVHACRNYARQVHIAHEIDGRMMSECDVVGTSMHADAALDRTARRMHARSAHDAASYMLR